MMASISSLLQHAGLRSTVSLRSPPSPSETDLNQCLGDGRHRNHEVIDSTIEPQLSQSIHCKDARFMIDEGCPRSPTDEHYLSLPLSFPACTLARVGP